MDWVAFVYHMEQFVTNSVEETIELGRRWGSLLAPNNVLCFFGNLGAGKTSIIRGIAEGVSGYTQVNSPTFVYMNIYSGRLPVYHFDLYRLSGVEEFLSMGFDDYFDAGGICCIEWSERIETILPKSIVKIEMKHLGGDKREIVWI